MSLFIHLLETYKYFILLPVDIIEGPITTVIASFLASLGFLNVFIVYGFAVLGDIIGDLGLYWIGRLGRNTIIPRYGHYVGVTNERLKFAEEHYKKHLASTVFLGKIVDVTNLPILLTAGVTKTDMKKYLQVISVAALGKAAVFTVIGYYFGRFYITINNILHNFNLAITIVVLAALLAFGVYKIVLNYFVH